jgi:hypothetical protein
MGKMHLSERQQAAIDAQEAWKLIYDHDGMQVYRNSETDEFRTVGDTRKMVCEMAQECYRHQAMDKQVIEILGRHRCANVLELGRKLDGMQATIDNAWTVACDSGNRKHIISILEKEKS